MLLPMTESSICQNLKSSDKSNSTHTKIRHSCSCVIIVNIAKNPAHQNNRQIQYDAYQFSIAILHINRKENSKIESNHKDLG